MRSGGPAGIQGCRVGKPLKAVFITDRGASKEGGPACPRPLGSLCDGAAEPAGVGTCQLPDLPELPAFRGERAQPGGAFRRPWDGHPRCRAERHLPPDSRRLHGPFRAHPAARRVAGCRQIGQTAA